MRTPIYIFICFIMLFTSCKNPSSNEIEELTQVFLQLKNDTNHQLLKTLIPTDEDCRQIFTSGESAEMAVVYSASKWVNIEKVSNNSMKPLTEDAQLKVLSVSAKELKAGITNGFPSEYVHMAKHLKPGIRLYALQYLNPDGTEQKHRAAIFKANDRWVIIPQTFMAFK